MKSQGMEWWVDDLAEVCVRFQLDLSCLVDGELDEVAGASAIAHLEDCATCQMFFDDARAQGRAHRVDGPSFQARVGSSNRFPRARPQARSRQVADLQSAVVRVGQIELPTP